MFFKAISLACALPPAAAGESIKTVIISFCFFNLYLLQGFLKYLEILEKKY